MLQEWWLEVEQEESIKPIYLARVDRGANPLLREREEPKSTVGAE
jgi:hypothetical protein